jgi:ElaB/YqjD/DUF883 family membrane-anchored ribosome-binding protein
MNNAREQVEKAREQVDKAREKIETIGASARESLQDWRESAEGAAHRATRYVQDRLEQADDRIVDMTGQPLESWSADLKDYIRQHPVQSTLIAVGLGYILGKLISRG